MFTLELGFFCFVHRKLSATRDLWKSFDYQARLGKISRLQNLYQEISLLQFTKTGSSSMYFILKYFNFEQHICGSLFMHQFSVQYFLAVPIFQCLFGALLHRLFYPGHGQAENGEIVALQNILNDRSSCIFMYLVPRISWNPAIIQFSI